MEMGLLNGRQSQIAIQTQGQVGYRQNIAHLLGANKISADILLRFYIISTLLKLQILNIII
jgi:hypothetical protein